MTKHDDDTDSNRTVRGGSGGGGSRTIRVGMKSETLREPAQYNDLTRTGSESPGMVGSSCEARLPSALSERFKIVKVFPTRGGEADLYVVSDHNEKQWLVKLYREAVTVEKAVLERIRMADRRHVVGLDAFGFSDGRWWEVLEYVPLATLKKLLKRERGGRGPVIAKEILQQLAAALAHLHALDIVHRDLKPENVLVRSREPLDLVLTDFGSASIVEGTVRFTETARTLKYAPPEAQGTLTEDEHGRARNVSEVSRPGDYWCLGMILVEVLTGCHPFDEDYEGMIAHRLATMETGELSEDVSDPAWRKLCRGLLRRAPEHRWGADQIQQWLCDPNDPSLTVAAE